MEYILKDTDIFDTAISGKGTGCLIIIAGMLLCVTSEILYNLKSVKKLENRGELCITE